MPGLISKPTNTAPAGEDYIYTVDDPAGTPSDAKVTLANAITKAHGLSDELVKIASGVMTPAAEGTDYYAPGGTDVAIADGGTGAGTATAAFDALSPTTTEGDIIYRNGSNNVRLPKGTSGQVLSMNVGETAPEWSSAGGGGQTLYDKIVDSTGDYTTLQAALDAASSGETIFVRSGTYALAADKTYTNSLNNITIIGESPSASIVALSSYDIVFQGTNISIQNLSVTSTTGYIEFEGVQCEVVGSKLQINGSGTGGILKFGSASKHSRVDGNLIESTTTASNFVINNGYYTSISNNIVWANNNSATSSSGFIKNLGYSAVIAGNVMTLNTTGSAGEYAFIWNEGNLTEIIGNTIYPQSSYKMQAIRSSQPCNITGNFIYDCYDGIKVDASGSCTIVGNEIGQVRSNGNPIYCASPNSSISANTITNPASSGHQIKLVNADRSTVSSNHIAGGDVGVYIDSNTIQASVTGNNITVSNTFGIGISDAGGKTAMAGNSIQLAGGTSGCYGVFITGNYSSISANQISAASGNTGYGVYTQTGSTGLSITGNTMSNVYQGVYITDGYHVIADNTITNVNAGGISLGSETTICQNNLMHDATTTSSLMDESKVVRMKNTSGGSVANGDLVIQKSVAAGDEFTTTTTAGDSKVVGMACETISDTNTGFIKLLGKTTNLKVNGTADIAVGDYISTYTSVKIGQKASTGETVIAIALEAYTGDDSNGVIDALLIAPRLI